MMSKKNTPEIAEQLQDLYFRHRQVGAAIRSLERLESLRSAHAHTDRSAWLLGLKSAAARETRPARRQAPVRIA